MANLDGLVDLLADAVNHGSSVGFLPPISQSESLAFWQHAIREIGAGKRRLLVALDHGRVVGSVQLRLASQTNGRHRAEIEKLFVHTSERRKGYGTKLMEAVEKEAAACGRSLLVLDTVPSDAAAPLCRALNYVEVGSIPNYAQLEDGSRVPTTIFCKQMRIKGA